MKNDKKILKPADEWVLQADYDFGTAEAMLKAGRYIYAVFMAHLALEKLLNQVSGIIECLKNQLKK